MPRSEIRGGPRSPKQFNPDYAIGRRFAPTRWLHPGYELKEQGVNRVSDGVPIPTLKIWNQDIRASQYRTR
jgi:hypothetical protein